MLSVNALISEHAADLIDSLESADDQSLEVELERNAQLDVLVQRVEVRLERTRSGAARVGDQHRCLHFHKAACIEELSDLADDLGSLDKGLPGLLVHDQVHISLAVPEVRILKAVELLRQRRQRLGQKSELLSMYRDLACLGLEDKSLDADDVADVHALEALVSLFAQIVSGHIDLDPALFVLHVAERSLAHDALEHHAAGDGNGLVLQFVKISLDLRAVISLIIFDDLKGILSCCLQFREFLSSDVSSADCPVPLFSPPVCRRH